jgi:MFS family permease
MLGIGYLGGTRSNAASPYFLVPEVMAVVSAVAFVRHSARAASPFVSLRFLTGRGFGVMNLVNFLYGSAVLGFAPLIPLYAQNRYRLPPLQAGTLLTARAVGMIATAGLAVYLLRRTGYRWPMAIGFTLTAVGLIATAASPHGLSAYAWLATATGICGIGMGISTPASNNATLQLAPDDAAAVAGLRGMFRQAGAITAVSVTGAIVARSASPGLAQASIFLVFAAVLIAALPLVLLVPEHRGRW